MKKLLSLVLVSVLGGAITLASYKLFLEEEQPAFSSFENSPNYTIPVSHSNANFLPENAIDFTTAAENTVHSVVHVMNTSFGSSNRITFQDLIFGRSSQRPQVGSGSGVIISPDGYIITNNHVIDGANKLTVTLNDNRTYEAELIGTDSRTDIALIKINPDEDLPYSTFGDSDEAKIGEWVLAVGNPFNLTSTVTAGIISAKSRDLSGGKFNQSFIQTDAAVNPGNSGGALVNSVGELIGINTAISSQTGSYIGYSFAVPSNIARKVVEDIIEYGNVQNGVLGVSGGALNNVISEKYNINEIQGFYVDHVEEGSGADKAGIESGDIIKKIDNINITKFSDLSGYLNTKRPGDHVKVTLIREGNSKTVPVTLVKNQTFTVPQLGVLKNASEKELKKYGVSNGVKIAQLGETYAQYLRANNVNIGNIITSINNEKVYDVDDVQQIIKNRSPYEPLRIELINSNGELEKYNFR